MRDSAEPTSRVVAEASSEPTFEAAGAIFEAPGAPPRIPDEDQLIDLLSHLDRASIANALSPLGGQPACDGGLGRRWVAASGATTLLFDAHAAGVASQAHEFGMHVRFNRLTEKRHHAKGLMRAIPGTDLWVRTLVLDTSLRASYGFSVNSPSQQARPLLGIHRAAGVLQDPANPCVAEEVLDPSGAVAARWSLHEGPRVKHPFGADFSHALPANPPRIKATLRFASQTGLQELSATLGPAGGVAQAEAAASKSDNPQSALLIVLDADRWDHSPALGALLAQAHSQAKLPPVTWVGVSCSSIEQRKALLGGDRIFAASLVDECVRWASATDGVRLSGQVIITGASVGALCALHAAQVAPGRLRAAIAQSPSMWYTPARDCSPRDFETGAIAPLGQDWPTTSWELTPGAAALPSIIVQAGTNEPEICQRSAAMATHAAGLGWPITHQVFTGGHDLACWRMELFDALHALHLQRPLA